MAGAGDILAGEAETTSRRTIYDFLGDGEDGESAASQPSPETPPRLRLPRFTCARIRFGSLGRKRAGRKDATEAEATSSVDSSSGSSKQVEGTSTTRSVAATAAQTGMGLSMLFLLARTCVELNRMAEVRAQMEALLKEIRDEASRVKGATGHVVVATETCNNNLQASSTITASSSCVSDTSMNCLETRRGEDEKRASEDEGGCAGMEDELELEAELGIAESEQCQQAEWWKCDTEQETPECLMQSSDDEFIELDGGHLGRSGGGGDHCDDSDGEDGGGGWSSREREEGGVSAMELERRLHELRHRRDQERIEELESALRRVERRLTEKEMEARLWQDTAAMALGQPAPPGGQ